MKFESREDAGRQLAALLIRQAVGADIVLGLPRGGVVVAAEISKALQIPLDVLLVRKIGHPLHREFAVGALAESGVVILDPSAATHDHAACLRLERVVEEETARLGEYEQRFRANRPRFPRSGTVLIVDDGIATGATTEAAVVSATRQGAMRVTVAVPVASKAALDRLAPVADSVLALVVDPNFNSVGAYYQSFEQTSDEEVTALLHAARSDAARVV